MIHVGELPMNSSMYIKGLTRNYVDFEWRHILAFIVEITRLINTPFDPFLLSHWAPRRERHFPNKIILSPNLLILNSLGSSTCLWITCNPLIPLCFLLPRDRVFHARVNFSLFIFYPKPPMIFVVILFTSTPIITLHFFSFKLLTDP